MLIVTLFVGFFLGVLAVISVEALGFLFLIRKLGRKVDESNAKITKSVKREELDFSFPNKQGWVWILEEEKVPKTSLTDKVSRQQKRKVEILEVSPARKYAKVKDQSLVLTESDGSLTEISLLGCKVEAVSATNLPSRKWAKKYPIKVESKTSVVYHGSNLFYMYLETSSEKESWCKILRLAACNDKEKLMWFVKLRSQFHSYLTSLNIEYPSFLKPSIGFSPEITDRSIKIDGSSSKVRHFLKKLAKKASKSGVENSANLNISGREEKKMSERSYSVQESSSAGAYAKLAQTGKTLNHVADENILQSSLPASTDSESRNQFPLSADADSVDKRASDEGTLCWNLLASRLFFDAKSNEDLRKSIQARIQRTLSNMRTPSYVGEVICTGVDPGSLPPYIHGMRVLPSDLTEVMAMEVEVEYHGGLVLDIETRLEVGELDLPESVAMNSDSNSAGEVATDLLEGFEYFGQQLKLNEGAVQGMEHKGDGIPKLEDTRSFKGNEQASSNVSKWKSIVNSVAKQVSQVPLSLAIRVTTLRGTLRFYIKPPPSDQLWFGFTSMPDIDFSLESSVGDHKITSGRIALFLISRFKAAIRDTMVLPNCENIFIPWMLAEKDDWVPRKTAPFIWINQEPIIEPTASHEGSRSQPNEETRSQEAQKVSTSGAPRTTESTEDKAETETLENRKAVVNDKPLEDLRTPLLGSNQQTPEPPRQSSEDETRDVQVPNQQHPPSPPQFLVSSEEHNVTVEGDDNALRRMGTRARMLGLRKKVGEKLEEKRRHIEERGRHIVEKMRGPGPSQIT